VQIVGDQLASSLVTASDRDDADVRRGSGEQELVLCAGQPFQWNVLLTNAR